MDFLFYSDLVFTLLSKTMSMLSTGLESEEIVNTSLQQCSFAVQAQLVGTWDSLVELLCV